MSDCDLYLCLFWSIWENSGCFSSAEHPKVTCYLLLCVCSQSNPEGGSFRIFAVRQWDAARVQTSRVTASSVEEQEALTGRIPRLFICLCVAGGREPPPPLVEFLKFSLGFTFRYRYFSDQLIIVNTEWILQTITVLRASSQERSKVFCLHWCFISIHTQECLLITLFNHRVQIIWYFFLFVSKIEFYVSTFSGLFYIVFMPRPHLLFSTVLFAFLLSDRIHADILPVSGALLPSTPEPVRQTSKSRASSGFSGGGSAAAEVCYSWVGVGVGPFKWQQYYGCLKRTIAGNRFVFCLFFNQDATYFSFSILLPASLISCFSVLYKYGKYEKSLSFPP